MWAKIFLLFVGLLSGARLPLTSSQAATSAIVVCTITGFFPEGTTFEWLRGGQSGVLSPLNEQPTTYDRGNNSWMISARSFQLRQDAFICRLSPTASQTKLRMKIKESEDKGNGLHENLYRTNHKETSLQRTQAILTGMVIGLNASEVSVQWMKNALVEGHHVNPRVLKGSSKDSLLAFSQVIVPYSGWKNGTSYSCRFTNAAGTMKLTQRPEEKSQGAK